MERQMITQPKLPDAQERLRVNMGLQCPECHGVNIQTPERQSHQCQDCGCQWDRRYYPSLRVEGWAVGKEPKEFHFWMDARRFTVDREKLTGGEIKVIADTSRSYPVYRDTGPHFSDHEPVGDGVLVNITNAHFYSLIPATYYRG
jgi:hypothetical protein